MSEAARNFRAFAQRGPAGPGHLLHVQKGSRQRDGLLGLFGFYLKIFKKNNSANGKSLLPVQHQRESQFGGAVQRLCAAKQLSLQKGKAAMVLQRRPLAPDYSLFMQMKPNSHRLIGPNSTVPIGWLHVFRFVSKETNEDIAPTGQGRPSAHWWNFHLRFSPIRVDPVGRRLAAQPGAFP